MLLSQQSHVVSILTIRQMMTGKELFMFFAPRRGKKPNLLYSRADDVTFIRGTMPFEYPVICVCRLLYLYLPIFYYRSNGKR